MKVEKLREVLNQMRLPSSEEEWEQEILRITRLGLESGSGMSKLQRAILEVLRAFPSEGPIKNWARPKDILAALERESTNANRAAISKSLARLCERRFVTWAQEKLPAVGQGARYALTKTGLKFIARPLEAV